MGQILLKTDLNFKMSHIGEFIALFFCIVFVENCLKVPFNWQKMIIAEMSSELIEKTFFRQICVPGEILQKTV